MPLLIYTDVIIITETIKNEITINNTLKTDCSKMSDKSMI